MRDKAAQAGSILLTVYSCLLFAALSFYMPEGYHELGSARFTAYRAISLLFAVPLSVCAVMIAGSRFFRGETRAARERAVLPADVFAFACVVSSGISLLLSQYKETALWGTEGWFMGFGTQLLFFAYYYFARLFPLRLRLVGMIAALCGGAVVCLAVADRLGFSFLSIMGADRSFISTIGNVDWYCGYLAIVLSVALGVFFGGVAGRGRKRGLICILLSVYLALCVVSAVTQGALSGYLILIGAVLTIPAVVLRPGRKGVRVLLAALPVLYLVILCALPVFWFSADSGETVVLTFWQRFSPAILFGDDFGNGRGGIWRISWRLWHGLTLKQRLFGIGPDVYADYAYASPEIGPLLYGSFGAARLTNAHSEWLTLLVDEGVAALLCWILFSGASFICLMGDRRQFSEALENRCAASSARRGCLTPAALFAMVTLGAVQAVSFRTVTATPLLLLLIGAAMGEAQRLRESNPDGFSKRSHAFIEEDPH